MYVQNGDGTSGSLSPAELKEKISKYLEKTKDFESKVYFNNGKETRLVLPYPRGVDASHLPKNAEGLRKIHDVLQSAMNPSAYGFQYTLLGETLANAKIDPVTFSIMRVLR